MTTFYNSFVNMEYGRNNLLTRIIDAVKRHKVARFRPDDVHELLNEGGRTPGQTIKACITCNTKGYRGLEGKRPCFVRIFRGVYELADRP